MFEHKKDNFLTYLTKNNLWTPISIIIAGAMISCTIWHTGITSSGSIDTVTAPVAKAAQAVDASKVKTQGEPIIGKTNAPLTIAIWTDYQCPFCKRFEADAVDQLYKNYVQTGKAKIIFKDFAFLGADSTTLALAGRAVWDATPAKYYAWRTYIYEHQGQEHSGWGTKDKVLALTANVLTAAEVQKVSGLMESKKSEYQKAIDADKAEGSSFGVTGTPGTIVGKTYINGAQSFATVKAAVEKELTK